MLILRGVGVLRGIVRLWLFSFYVLGLELHGLLLQGGGLADGRVPGEFDTCWVRDSSRVGCPAPHRDFVEADCCRMAGSVEQGIIERGGLEQAA